jgi:lipopolysaccharide transport system permease protein
MTFSFFGKRGLTPFSHVHVLRPTAGRAPVDFGELWAARELLYFLVWRDLKVRYRQTVLGALWAIVQPVLAVAIFTLFFGKLIGVSSDGAPYPVFALAGLVPWAFFANGVTVGAGSLVANELLVRRVYFPRLVIPAGAVLAGSLDAAISTVLLLLLAFSLGVAPALTWLLAPLFLALTALTSLGVAIVLAALNVRFRDVQHIVPFFMQLLMFSSPIVYSSGILPQPWRTLYALNPVVGIIEGVRWSLFGTGGPPLAAITLSVVVTAGILVCATIFFRRTERTFADVI